MPLPDMESARLARLAEIRAEGQRMLEYAERIRVAVGRAGFDTAMLDDLPPTYVSAALALGVK